MRFWAAPRIGGHGCQRIPAKPNWPLVTIAVTAAAILGRGHCAAGHDAAARHRDGDRARGRRLPRDRQEIPGRARARGRAGQAGRNGRLRGEPRVAARSALRRERRNGPDRQCRPGGGPELEFSRNAVLRAAMDLLSGRVGEAGDRRPARPQGVDRTRAAAARARFRSSCSGAATSISDVCDLLALTPHAAGEQLLAGEIDVVACSRRGMLRRCSD